MKNEKSLSDLIEEYQEQKGLYHLEGEEGTRNLCRLVRAIGYKDTTCFGQFRGGCYGDLIDFFSDNPGAIEAVTNWIGDQNLTEWSEKITAELVDQPDEDEEREEE